MKTTALPPIEELVPHRGEVLLIDRAIAFDGVSTEVLVETGARGWLRGSDDTLPPWLVIEYMAQCVAAHEGLVALAEGRGPPVGFLVAAQGVRLEVDRLAAGRMLRVGARRVRGRPGLGVLSHFCTVHVDAHDGDGALVAEGRLSVSLPGAQLLPPAGTRI